MGKRIYTEEEKSFLISHIPGHTYQQTIDAFEKRYGRRLTAQILNGCCNHWHVRTGTETQFQKGHVPACKGQKIPREKQGIATQFKKGHMPSTYRPVGSERYDAYHNSLYVKVADPNVWKPKGKAVWEQHYGRMPPGHVILFRDGDRNNYSPDNLACVSKSVQIAIRWLKIDWHDPETFETLLAMTKVNIQCGTRKKRSSS